MADIVAKDLTPNRKRKRDHEKVADVGKDTCFINVAFNASTPKKSLARRRFTPPSKENLNPLSTCMEIKSIAELVEQHKNNTIAQPAVPNNPYEVQRKPPKKKKREMSIGEACFENPALNLSAPEKQFNPYEIVRDVNKNHEDQRKCFVNAALNIKAQDSVATVRNPFEVDREDIKNNLNYSEVPVTSSVQPTSLQIGIPFTPTVGCRIDFNNIPLTKLTPNKLMFAEKLVFSPVPKRSLDAISEESSSVSIGKELDRYQLELENSINEAKMRKQENGNPANVIEKECVYQLQLKVEKRVSLSAKLSDIAESEEYEIKHTEDMELSELKRKGVQVDLQNQAVAVQHTIGVEKPINNSKLEEEISKPEADLENGNGGIAGLSYDSDEEDNADFKAPAPFVRAYRRDITTKCITREVLISTSPKKLLVDNANVNKKQNIVKNLLRKSVRKIMPNNHDPVELDSNIKPMSGAHETKDHEEKPCTLTSHIVSSLRQSLRRKPKPKLNLEPTETANPLNEISIIDTSERKMKLKSLLVQNEYARIEDLTNEKKHNIRQGSLRHSTREMRQQIMKTLFQHKQEEYSFQK